ncbi:PIN domain-containing protein [Arthrospiribacter ruber]|uniref:PIN domain-containing protein n=1 Tax=Arthrospiribacter ruber TaxID=2487934 RepID=A0A951MD54_9BACT|nr:PIN domain-containing protein [Arthrospiribacter ruber]MBW3467500.1 PIN domain-containing protein [Arthrospiribacter ruber]
MKVLLDTNIVIHRETDRVTNQNIGVLFYWLDKLHITKCVHPLTLNELKKYADQQVVKSISIKLDNYQLLQTPAPLKTEVQTISEKYDTKPNDFEDTKLLNEVFVGRVDYLITEDRKIRLKAKDLNLLDRVFGIDGFLEMVISENPELVDYSVLSVKKEFFGNIALENKFFDSFRNDYVGFDRWYNGKAGDNAMAYVCYEAGDIKAFLYMKLEDEKENYSNMAPTFSPKKRLKIGTFKVVSTGLRIGERFLKIVFDNARQYKVDEIYVTIFDGRPELLGLIHLLEKFGFEEFGTKTTSSGTEKVFVRDFTIRFNERYPSKTFPWLSSTSSVYIVPIKPEYHTELFPDSILKTESPLTFVENKPHRNSISKSYISHSWNRGLKSGDIVVFYRSGGIYKGVATTIGIVEGTIDGLKSLQELIQICKKRSVLTEEELAEYWNRFPKNRPFVFNFLYAFSFKKRINLKEMLDKKILPSMDSIKTICKMGREEFKTLITLAGI